MATVSIDCEKNLGNRVTGKDKINRTVQMNVFRQENSACHQVGKAIQGTKSVDQDLSAKEILKVSSMSSPPHSNGSALEPTTPNKEEDRKSSLTRGGNSNVELARSPAKCGPKFCLQCGSTKTPLWRNGPLGAKTLCNACGIRYNKMKAGKKCRTPFNETSPLASTCPKKQISDSQEIFISPRSSTKRGLWYVNHGSASIPTKKRSKLVGRRVAEAETSGGSSHDANPAKQSDEWLTSRRSSPSKSIRSNFSRDEVLKQYSCHPELVEAADLLMALCYGPNWMEVV